MIRLLTSRLAGPIASGVALLLAIALVWVIAAKNATISGLDRQVTTLSQDLKAARRDLTQCRTNRITLEDATRRQNAAIQQVRAETATRLETLGMVAQDARRQAAGAMERARLILARRGTGDGCADAEAAIREAIR